jgi:hypothetical protein
VTCWLPPEAVRFDGGVSALRAMVVAGSNAAASATPNTIRPSRRAA